MKSAQIRSFFWSVFFCIRIEYEDLRSKSPYDQKNSVFGHFSRSGRQIINNTSLFAVVKNTDASDTDLNSNLRK